MRQAEVKRARVTRHSGSDDVDEVAWYWRNSGDIKLAGAGTGRKYSRTTTNRNSSAARNPTSWDFTTCQAMSGSGAGIGSAIIWRRTLPTQREAKAALAGFGEAAVGSATLSSPSRLSEAAWRRTARAPIRVFVWFAASKLWANPRSKSNPAFESKSEPAPRRIHPRGLNAFARRLRVGVWNFPNHIVSILLHSKRQFRGIRPILCKQGTNLFLVSGGMVSVARCMRISGSNYKTEDS